MASATLLAGNGAKSVIENKTAAEAPSTTILMHVLVMVPVAVAVAVIMMVMVMVLAMAMMMRVATMMIWRISIRQ